MKKVKIYLNVSWYYLNSPCHADRLFRAAVPAPFLKVSKAKIDRAWSPLV